MRKLIKDFVALAVETLPIQEPIYEFGSYQVEGQEGFADLRPYFPGKRYIGADIRPGTGVDEILDLHGIQLPDNSVGTVLCLDTLEHVRYPNLAVWELHRILKPGGIAVLTSVMECAIHFYPEDFWRFSPEGFQSLLSPFSQTFVGWAGKEDFPHTVIGVGIKSPGSSFALFYTRYKQWQKYYRFHEGDKLKGWLKLLLPPVGFSFLLRLKKHI